MNQRPRGVSFNHDTILTSRALYGSKWLASLLSRLPTFLTDGRMGACDTTGSEFDPRVGFSNGGNSSE